MNRITHPSIRTALPLLGVIVLLLSAGCLGAITSSSPRATTSGSPSPTVSVGTGATGGAVGADPATDVVGAPSVGASAGAVGGVTGAPSVSLSTEDGTVAVAASGSVSVAPDLAVVQLSAVATADSPDAARAQVASDVSAVRSALANAGVPKDAITTAYYAIQPQYDYSNGHSTLVGYRAVHALTVKTGVDAAGDVVDAAVGAGGVQVNSVQFTLSDAAQQSAREDALRAAMSHAKGDANAVASAADATLGGVRSVSTGGSVVTPGPRPVAMTEASSGGKTTLNAGPVTVTATVQVVYGLQ